MFDITGLLHGMAQYTHFISFGLLLVAGFSLPVSEDLVFIISASIAATTIPDNTPLIFAGCYLGAFTGDLIAYTIGRYGINRILFSPLLIKSRIVSRDTVEKKLEKAKWFFNRFGGKTLFFGRFIPFGVRNVIFMSCGLTRMPYPRFMLIDLFALLFTSSILFFLGYSFGNNYETIISYINRYKIILFIFFALLVFFLLVRRKLRSRKEGRLQVAPEGNDISKNDL